MAALQPVVLLTAASRSLFPLKAAVLRWACRPPGAGLHLAFDRAFALRLVFGRRQVDLQSPA